MMFVSIVGHASFQTAGRNGPSMIERSYLRRSAAVGAGAAGVEGLDGVTGPAWGGVEATAGVAGPLAG
jgi:hypothetical protein